MDIPEQHPLTTKHMASMIDLFHWKDRYRELQEGGDENHNRPILEDNDNVNDEDGDMDMMYGAGIGDAESGFSEVVESEDSLSLDLDVNDESDHGTDDNVECEDDGNSPLFEVEPRLSEQDVGDMDNESVHGRGGSFEVGRDASNGNIDVERVQELEDQKDDEKELELDDDLVVLDMTPFDPSNGNVRRRCMRRRRDDNGGVRGAKRRKIDHSR